MTNPNDLLLRKEFREVMAMLFLAYRQPLDSEATDVYYKFLKKHPMDKIKKAIADIISQSTRFPTIADILEFMVEDEASETEVRADIMDAISEYGMYKNPKFKYMISAAITEDLGWQSMCKMTRVDLNDIIHFRYIPVLDTWRDCQKKGLPFKIPGAKGILGERGKSKFRQIGDLLSENKPSDKSG